MSRYILSSFIASTLLFLVISAKTTTANEYVEALKELSAPLDHGLSTLYRKMADRRLVLLGESSHGTSEYYRRRGEISRTLIESHGFSFIAVEGDWNAIHKLNQYVKRKPDSGNSAREIMSSFGRWPVWMWANEETADLVEWLREWNAGRDDDKMAGIYGIDVYGKEDAIRELPKLLALMGNDASGWIKDKYRCFDPYMQDIMMYAQARRMGMPSCGDAVREVVQWLKNERETMDVDAGVYLHMKQMAWVVKNGEKHISAMAQGGPDSWNHRVDHFYQTVDRLLDHYGNDAKGIVWAHNTHIGDARATAMIHRGQRNIGQLARESIGRQDTFAVGFGTHRGVVFAGRVWGGAREAMNIPPAMPGSLEDMLFQAGSGDLLIVFEETPQVLQSPVGHRAIGVIYHPEHEAPGNYVPTILPERYDAFIFIEETEALSALM
ncbi:MAG TPA: erythromycin esterase family protein [Kiritimatiellia bacterium]|nr:erythromycin esterase family protein [Kiritimatiellia bacterium]